MTTRFFRVIRFRVTRFKKKSPQTSSSNHWPVRDPLYPVYADFSLWFLQARFFHIRENNTNTRISSIDGAMRHDRIVDALNVTVDICLTRFVFLRGCALLPFGIGPS
ncbi:hypothetical protein V8G54_007558 [Vigna mungo]|uniref:Uncharacterized protein n=1 Tax=Vigna mungo TaxID=3915 RepID=A0AAQ3S927_VIGMU